MEKWVLIECSQCNRKKFAHDEDYEEVNDTKALALLERFFQKRVADGLLKRITILCPFCQEQNNPE